MHQANINLLDAKLAPETLEVGARGRRIARLGLRKHRHLVARHVLQRLCHVRMASIRIGSVKKAQAVIVAIHKQIG
jgi:hypothetical protein